MFDIPLPNWLPNDYIQGLADVIERTLFVPPIVVRDDELLSPDIVAALVTVKARGNVVPSGIAVMDGQWLVKVDRRASTTQVNWTFAPTYIPTWITHITPYTIPRRDTYWTH